MRFDRVLVAVTVVVGLAVAALAVVLFTSDRDEDRQLAGSPSVTGEGSVAASADAVAGDGAEVKVIVRARMPQDVNDGVPRRRIVGTGVIEEGAALAGLELDMSQVPNSAGYFGHVPGSMSVVYTDSSFLVTFPILAGVLESDREWIRYDLGILSDPRAMGLGIGQLREVGLADPRLGIWLLSSGSAGPQGADQVLQVVPSQARAGAPEHLDPVLEQMTAMGIDQVDLTPELDEAGELTGYSYELEYPPIPDSTKNVRLRVSVEMADLGQTEAVDVPPDEAVQPYGDVLGI